MKARLQALTAEWCARGIHPVLKCTVVKRETGRELVRAQCDYCGRIESEEWWDEEDSEAEE